MCLKFNTQLHARTHTHTHALQTLIHCLSHRKELQKESLRLKKEMLEAKRRREEELRGKQIEAEDSKLCVDCLCQPNTSCWSPYEYHSRDYLSNGPP